MLHIITPVHDSLQTATDTIRAVMASQLVEPHTYTVYDDNSSPATAEALRGLAAELGFRLLPLSELTPTPSPNYLTVLRHARQESLAAGAPLLIVESDVTVKPATLQGLLRAAAARPEAGLVAAVTVDAQEQVNYPFLFARRFPRDQVVESRKHISFCCTLLTQRLLHACDFAQLNPEKNWFDVFISHQSLAHGLRNYVCMPLTVLHRPHQSRPWKQLKYTNPWRYYWRKLTRGLDKI